MKKLLLILLGLTLLASCQSEDDIKPPLPTYGGSDFLNVGDFMIQLNADSLKSGDFGYWRILSGELGDKVSLENKNDPKTIFHGLPGENYQLIWEVKSDGKAFMDTVIVSFLPLTTDIFVTGREFYQTRLELIAESYDRGEWTIEVEYHHIIKHMNG